MGYTTEFSGKFKIDPPLSPEQVSYLQAFAGTRRMAREPMLAAKMDDPLRIAVGLPLGPEGAFFVGGQGFAGQDSDLSVTNFNKSPSDQPGLWCQFTPSDNGKFLQWDGGEKFYDYKDWLVYITDNFIQPWGLSLNGDVKWRGEDIDDRGVLIAKNNKISSLEGDEYASYLVDKKVSNAAKKQKKTILSELSEHLERSPSTPKNKI